MSAAMPYLRGLRKSDLTELAEASDLKNYESAKKADLEGLLDNHLRSNHSIFHKDERFSEYYRRLSSTGRASPVKKEPKSSDAVATPSEEPKKSSRGRKSKTAEDATDESEETPAHTKSGASTAVVTRTPGRSPLALVSALPPSPAAVTDAIDRQTTLVRKKVGEAWSASGVSDHSDSLRAALSSVKAIETIIVALEGLGLANELIPFRYLTTVPALDTVRSPEFGIKVPDLFVLLTGSFWAPFSLWALTSLVLPLTFSYFINLSHRAQSGSHAYGTRRSTSSVAPAASFDPLVFNISKALIAYLVYANHFTFWDTYSNFSIERVNVAIPGHWPGLLTASAIGVLTSLYDAILKK